MNPIRIMTAVILLAATGVAGAAAGLVAVKSPYGPGETLDRLESVARDKGLTVFERVDHAAGAASVDMALRPTEVLIFGHPKGGTPFMQCAQSVGIDLPLKALAWQDARGSGLARLQRPGLHCRAPRRTGVSGGGADRQGAGDHDRGRRRPAG